MRRYFRIARRARREIHQHEVVVGDVLVAARTLEHVAVFFHFGVKVVPAVAVFAHHHFDLQRRAGFLRHVHLVRHVVFAGGDNGFHARRLEAVLEVVFDEQVRGGDDDCAQFMQSEYGNPELIVSLQHQHDPVALFDALCLEIVGGFI